MMFEGVALNDILNLKVKGVDGENSKLIINDKIIPISEFTLNCINQACINTEYIGRYKHPFKYLDSDYVIKNSKSEEDPDRVRRINILSNVLSKKSKKHLGKKLISADLYNSGFCHYLKCIELDKGVELQELDLIKTAIRYGIGIKAESSINNYKAIYMAYKEYSAKYDLDVEIDEEDRKILVEIYAIDVNVASSNLESHRR